MSSLLRLYRVSQPFSTLSLCRMLARFNWFQYGGEVKQKSILGRLRSRNRSARCDESPFNVSCFDVVVLGVSASLFFAIATYLELISTPTAFLPLALAASRVLPVPRNGSRTHIPGLVKNSMNPLTSDSGNPAGELSWSGPVVEG